MTGKRQKVLAAFEVYSLYLLTGAACITIGSSMTQLIDYYHVNLAAIAMLGSAFALGRVVTVSGLGWLVEKVGAKHVLGLGTVCLLAFLIGIPAVHSYPFALVVSVLGGIGMGTQDAAGPVILSTAFPKSYASAMSASQACFGAGCFLPPLCMSIVLAMQLPFYYTYYLFALLGVVMLVILPFVKLPKNEELAKEGGHAENPLFLRAKIPGWLLYGLAAVAYCAVVNTINLYTSTFAESLGIPAALAVSMLTAYNVGSMIGSLSFIILLRKVKPMNVLWFNTAAALICMSVALWLQNTAVFFVALFLTGFFTGVLFSILITLATGLEPAHAGIVAGLVATLCGCSDTVIPLITGPLVTSFGPIMAYWFVIAMLALTLVAALGFRALCREGIAPKKKI
ncbi:MAG: MFS transporter [Ruthenibacterium sp.]